ncbi:PspA/IM30 family protein [Mitsuokella multacida]|uniref:PspA/IM30 family protein n=1 Tax=Mitsuokella multacida TaxID=52226 RepID=UPI00241EF714|nr:hypothetical protein [Mitsuokella multacida]
MYRLKWCLPIVSASICLFPVNGVEAAPAEDWVYKDLGHLAQDGYLKLPQKDVRQLNRAELSELVENVLDNIETNPERYTFQDRERLNSSSTGKSMHDAGHVDTYPNSKQIHARRATDALARQSLRGVNRLEVMRRLKAQAEKEQTLLEKDAVDWAAAKGAPHHDADTGVQSASSEWSAEYGLVTRMILDDRVRIRLAEEQLRRARKQLGKQADGIEYAKRDVEIAAKRLSWRRQMEQALVRRQSMLMRQISSDGASYDIGALSDDNRDDLRRISDLRAEFIAELQESGYIDAQNAHLADDLPVQDILLPRFRVDGEVRVSRRDSSGGRREYHQDVSELRTRIYPDYDIDGNWHAIGMFEAKKNFGDRDDHVFRFDRYYLEGMIGAAKMTIGATSSFMANGNVYDSKFRGLRIRGGQPVVYTFEYGKANDADQTWDLSADYEQPLYGLGAGFYQFVDGRDRFDRIVPGTQSIAMLRAHRLMGDFDAGIMLLYGRDRGHDGTGYVLSLLNGTEKSWVRHNRNWWLNYYYQPYETYYQHTMNGTADIMRKYGGMKGIGIGYSYTVAPDLLWNIEYYHLNELDGGKNSNTIWTALTYYFKNYED